VEIKLFEYGIIILDFNSTNLALLNLKEESFQGITIQPDPGKVDIIILSLE